MPGERTLLVTICCLLALAATASPDEPKPEQRALAFLSREVPKWSVENKCFSCHNNGDGARALFAAKRLGYRVDGQTLNATTAWLAQPDKWEHNGGKAEFSDKKLAAIQFSAALAAAIECGVLGVPQKDQERALLAAAEQLKQSQEPDGSWRIDQGAFGSPVTYGSELATATSRRVLVQADPRRFAKEIAAADNWLLAQRCKTVPAAAAVLLALDQRTDAKTRPQQSACQSLLAKVQDKSGGWGPYVNAAPEAFDTALALLALWRYRESPEVRKQIDRGRQHLIETQLSDGSWVETTRPAGAESYAQRLSTTGWATLALLETRP